MTDIVERLREYGAADRERGVYPPDGLIAEAVTEITNWRRTALQQQETLRCQAADYDALAARLAEAERDAELGRIAIKFVDRAGDVCEEDTARIICAEFYNAMANAVERQREARGLPGMRITDSAGAEHD